MFIPTCAGDRIALRAVQCQNLQSDLQSLVGDMKPWVESAKSIMSDKKPASNQLLMPPLFAFDNWDVFAGVRCVTVCFSELRCVVVCCSALQCGGMRCILAPHCNTQPPTGDFDLDRSIGTLTWPSGMRERSNLCVPLHKNKSLLTCAACVKRDLYLCKETYKGNICCIPEGQVKVAS